MRFLVYNASYEYLNIELIYLEILIMSSKKQLIIDFLLDNADPSIVLRVKKEVLNSLSEREERELLDRIIPQKNVQTVIQSQKPDGWFGNNLHEQSAKNGAGMFDNMEVGLRYLAEKGFPPENEYISKAVESFLTRASCEHSNSDNDRNTKNEDYKYTAIGLYLIRSSLIIRAGYEYRLPKNEFIDLKYDIDLSFDTFTEILNYDSPCDVLDTSKRKLCFKPGVRWPCLYNLRMLAFSRGWRSEKNTSLLAESLNRLFSFSMSDEMVYIYVKGQYVAPCFAFIHSQANNLGLMDKDSIPLDLMELFARCGIVDKVIFLKDKYESLLGLIDDDLNVNLDVDKKSAFGWSPYFGYALEEDWKKKIRKQCDLLFRILMIMHHVEASKCELTELDALAE